MKTMVLQSYRAGPLPAWLTTCLASVRDWAALRGYEYRFVDDRFFDRLPDWFLPLAGPAKTIWADYARVLWAQEVLAQGYQRFIWADADLLIFDAANLHIDNVSAYSFCHEVWPLAAETGKPQRIEHRINNSLCMFSQGNPFIAFYLHAMERILRRGGVLEHDALGTRFLTHLGMVMPMPVCFTVGLFNPRIMRAVADQDAALLSHYVNASKAPLAAANLCLSFLEREVMGVRMQPALYEQVVAECLASGGDNINRHRRPAAV